MGSNMGAEYGATNAIRTMEEDHEGLQRMMRWQRMWGEVDTEYGAMNAIRTTEEGHEGL